MSESKVTKNGWRLQSIEIEFQKYGKHKDKYAGIIKFENGEREHFQFNIQPEMAQPYIDLMAKDIVRCAEDLGTRLTESLNLKNEG